MAYLTVFTSTYNRVNKIINVYKSLCRQEFKDFEWLIVDDGSTDGTDKLIAELQRSSIFPIRYYWKENGGNHTARNYGFPFINTKYVVPMDSDDIFTDNALQRIHDIWESIPDEDYDRYWQVSGRCADLETGKMMGSPYPAGINNLRGREQIKARYRIPEEKCCCRKTEILRRYPFPEYEGVKFVSEDTIWTQIDKIYDTYCTNDIFRLYDISSDDSIGRGKIHSKSYRLTQWHWSIYAVNDLFDWILFDKRVMIAIANLPRLTWLSGLRYSAMLKKIKSPSKRILECIVTPFSFVLTLIHDREEFWNEKDKDISD